jgi:Uncharacterized protein conserved in bacteria
MTIRLGKYKHAKSGRLYEVVGVGKHSETLEELVIYKPLYESETKFWIRPIGMWNEEVIIDGKKRKRFEKIVE